MDHLGKESSASEPKMLMKYIHFYKKMKNNTPKVMLNTDLLKLKIQLLLDAWPSIDTIYSKWYPSSSTTLRKAALRNLKVFHMVGVQLITGVAYSRGPRYSSVFITAPRLKAQLLNLLYDWGRVKEQLSQNLPPKVCTSIEKALPYFRYARPKADVLAQGLLLCSDLQYLKFEPRTDQFFLYEKQRGCYVSVDKDLVSRRIYALLRHHLSLWCDVSYCTKMQYFNQVMFHILSSIPDLDLPEFDYHHISYTNGLLNVHTKELREHTPDIFITSAFTRDYDPKGEPINFINATFGDTPTSTAYVRAALALLLRPTNEYRANFIILGGNATANARTEKVIASLFGADHRIVVPLSSLKPNNYGILNLQGKRLIIITEHDKSQPNWTVLNQLLARDPIHIHSSKQPDRTLTVRGSILIRARQGSSAWNEMIDPTLKIIPIDSQAGDTPEGSDSKWETNLMNERDAIINWALDLDQEQAIKCLRESSASSVYSNPRPRSKISKSTINQAIDTIAASQQEYDYQLRGQSVIQNVSGDEHDYLDLWITEQLTPGPGAYLGYGLSTDDQHDPRLYPTFMRWCASKNVNPDITHLNFTQHLLAKLKAREWSVKKKERKSGVYIEGVQINIEPHAVAQNKLEIIQDQVACESETPQSLGRPRKDVSDSASRASITPKKRGRPRKDGYASASSANLTPKKRGRPRKEGHASTSSASLTPKKRGRPPKDGQRSASSANLTPKKRGRPRKEGHASTSSASLTPKKRGRPRKDGHTSASSANLTPKKRGRPRKEGHASTSSDSLTPKKRGRPRKDGHASASSVSLTPKKRRRPPKDGQRSASSANLTPKKRGRPRRASKAPK